MPSSSSYPITEVPGEIPQGSGGAGVFDDAGALAINEARLAHLESLELPLGGTSVLDVGCGVGHLALFFLRKGCRVSCVDGRPQNIDELRKRLPGLPAHVAHVETDDLTRFGRFQVVFCYGLLYHLENPIAALRNMAAVCEDVLLLETVISDHRLPINRLLDEPRATANQALGGLGCRPTPAFVAMGLTRAGFEYVYAPVTPPNHPDFQFEWLNNLDCARDNHLLRCIFVASRKPLDNPRLKLLLNAPSGLDGGLCFTPLSRAESKRIWLDVGAHLGEKTFAHAQQDPSLRVFAFEPNLEVAAQRMGQLPNFVVLPLAVAEHEGSAEFHVNRFDSASSLLPFVPEGLEQWAGRELLGVAKTVTVPTIRLETFLDQAGIAGVEFLKIDAQGADLQVLRSCGKRLRDVERIEVEVQITDIPLYQGAGSKEDILDLLTAAGFELESSQQQSLGQEENLRFVRSTFPDAETALRAAKALAQIRPLGAFPGWHFGIDWENPNPAIRKRQTIWNYFQRRNRQVPLEFDWYDGLKLILYLANDISRSLFVEGSLDPNEFFLLDHLLEPGMVVVDAGANEGLYTVFAAQKVRKTGCVLAFEPSPRDFQRLQNNIRANSLKNVESYDIALGSSESRAVLHIAADEHAGQNTLGKFAYPGIEHLSDQTVQVRPLDAIIEERGVNRLDFLKLDVEGAETSVVKGAANSIRRYRPVILLEVVESSLQNYSSTPEELLACLHSLGYTFYVFDSATGLPRPAAADEFTENMLAAPCERPLKAEWCSPTSETRPESLRLMLHDIDDSHSPFALSSWVLCNSGQVVEGDRLTILTPPEQWSYALLFQVREQQRKDLPPAAQVAIRLEVAVHEGRAGFAVIASDLQTLLTREIEIESAEAPAMVEFTLPCLPAGCSIVVRNTASSGRASRISLRSLTTLVSENRLDVDRH